MSSGSHPLSFQKGTGIFLRLCWLLMRVWNFDYQNVLLESLISLNSYDVTITAALRPSLSLDGIRSPNIVFPRPLQQYLESFSSVSITLWLAIMKNSRYLDG
ncbi:hypothetical protein I7I50_03875 [Histoplasma capsulatum G186AR]|uniref:Uncharacterized protein n=1 Tax=Ajellomyces capsulatus TaxID=5037 RepID=A0A8H8CXL1_AJECA|nr:hypothetical protein I7I52_04783 [Histoplasma capsulatum]QSS74912.1 hypothetical protein I7I50_03875 [Histoplasma capsulatum G186AR]